MDRESPSADDYFVTAVQIFDYCGAENSGSLRVNTLMEKFAPFVKTNKAEYSCLKSILDPDQDNPEINVTKLAKALHKYSETQKTKVDLDESFNLKSGQAPQDSDSGISTDGFQLLEELQCELREKTHLAHQLRSQLDFTDKQHEEALATMIAERDSLRTHLNMLRDENITLTHLKRDYEDACDRLCASEQALSDVRKDLDSVKKKAKVLHEQVSCLENEKLTLQELLTKSKDECHRINEMYAARQSALLEENETLKTEHADLTSRLQDQEEFMQQIIKEKVLLEMELKDTLNKSNQTHLRMDRSIDISYTEDQMLTALDTLNADSRFSQENRILDEDSFLKTLNEDQGRVTNMSLFDEIRLSFYNKSRLNMTDFNDLSQYERSSNLDISYDTQADTRENMFDTNYNRIESDSINILRTQTCVNVPLIKITKAQNDCTEVAIQTFGNEPNESIVNIIETISKKTQTDNQPSSKANTAKITKTNVETQTFDSIPYFKEVQKTESSQTYDKQLYINMNKAQTRTNGTQTFNNIPISKEVRTFKSVHTQTYNKQLKINRNTAQTRTEGTHTFDNIQNCKTVRKYKTIDTQTYDSKTLTKTVEMQTVENVNCVNNNNIHNLKRCLECEKAGKYAIKLEADLEISHYAIRDMQTELCRCEDNLNNLQNLIEEGNNANIVLQSLVKNLKAKIEVLEQACSCQRDVINGMCRDTSCVDCQTEVDLITVGTQAEVPCIDCENRKIVTPQRNLRRFFWEPIKCMFQLFALICFICAISVLYGVTRRWHAPCKREPLPWRWFDAQDLMDLFLRIDYGAEVPM